MRVCLFLFVFASVFAGEAPGCTSFSWFGDGGPLYGMNFDWDTDSEISFALSQGDNGSTVFAMSFRDGDSDPVPIVGMNSFGVFSSMQVIDETVGIHEPGPDERMVWAPFYYGLWEAAGYEEISRFVKSVPLVQYEEIPLHLHIASPTGSAMTVEVGEQGNRVVEMGDDDFLVMTNFSNSSFAGTDPEDVTGGGADRYLTVYEMLSGASSLDVMGAFCALKATLNSGSDIATRASMVFDPVAGEVYIALDGEMKTIWKVTLETSMVEGVFGLPEGLSYPLPEEGITSEELVQRVEGYVLSAVLVH
jgi:hypothetical protein